MILDTKNISFDIHENLNKENTSFIYGEANYKDLLLIFKKFKINNFLDIGSGSGKIVLAVAIYMNIFSSGIEIDEGRYNKSIFYLNHFNDHKLYERTEFFNDDFRDIYFGEYDLIYCCNTVFSDIDNESLYEKIKSEFYGIFILFDYPNNFKKYLIFEKEISTTWNKNVKVYIFRKLKLFTI